MSSPAWERLAQLGQAARRLSRGLAPRRQPRSGATLPPSFRRWAALLAGTAAFAVIAGLAAWRSLAAWGGARRELSAFERQVAAARAASSRLAAVRTELAAREERLGSLERVLPRQDGVPDLLRRIERLSAAAGAALDGYRADDPTPPPPPAGQGPGRTSGSRDAAAERYRLVPLTLRFSGGRPALLALLASLERELPAFVIDQADLRVAGSDPRNPLHTLSVTGRLYLLQGDAG